jgi:mannose-6-phosphate isomerase-like protein (cupin superfamily)
MNYSPINLAEKFEKFSEYFTPRVIAQLNDYQIKLGKFRGDFIWHRHPETDEVFLVVEGAMRIDFRDGRVNLRAGELFVVPKGMEHKPFAEEECKIMLIEPAGTVNTGDNRSATPAAGDVWI